MLFGNVQEQVFCKILDKGVLEELLLLVLGVGCRVEVLVGGQLGQGDVDGWLQVFVGFYFALCYLFPAVASRELLDLLHHLGRSEQAVIPIALSADLIHKEQL